MVGVLARAAMPVGRDGTGGRGLSPLGLLHCLAFSATRAASMPTVTTRDVRVSVESHYAPERSSPEKRQYFFLYTITIKNQGQSTVQLLRRHWVIMDGHGETQEVRGAGVVGEQPVLKPGESFRYTSGCPLSTSFGSMDGSYEMMDEDGESFDVKIPPFALRDPSRMQ